MKRLLSAALIMSLLGGTAAVAAPVGRADFNHSSHSNNGAVIAGVGLLALAAIVASQSQPDYGYQDNYYPRHDWRDHRDYRNRGWDHRGY